MEWSEDAQRLWREETTAVEQALATWRTDHPRATLAEIEAAVSAEMAGLRARLVERLAQATDATVVSAQPARVRPSCPQCQRPLRPRGRHRREVITEGEQVLRLEREYAVCPTCAVGLFPPG
jgi:hypothetical protein